MNKKFSTLVGCLAFGTAFSAVAQVSNFPVSNAYGQVTPCATGLTYRSFGTKSNATLAYIIHSGFISGYQNRYGDNLKPPTNVYHRMTA